MEVTKGILVDVWRREQYGVAIVTDAGRIVEMRRDSVVPNHYILPGWIDAHVHVESSMLTPRRFAEAASRHGTIAVVTDPHEIANVVGESGIEWMMKNGENSPVTFFWTIPSCVPATPLDNAGAVIDGPATSRLAYGGKFVGLSEMMNVPGVLGGDEEVLTKLRAARACGLPIDGHAPSLSGDDLRRYVSEGIATDHECSTLTEAKEKLQAGMKILIREGSAARNYAALHALIDIAPDRCMFCTDDSHPDQLMFEGHIDRIVRRAVADGHDIYDVIRMASVNAVEHWGLDIGLLRVGDRADFQIVRDLTSFECLELRNSRFSAKAVPAHGDHPIVNRFVRGEIGLNDLRRGVTAGEAETVLELDGGNLHTGEGCYVPTTTTSNMESDLSADVLKLVYLNRYRADSRPQVAWVRGFGIRTLAFAASVSHDNHNIIAAGVSDAALVTAINEVVRHKGGLAVGSADGRSRVLPLPVGGLMSDDDVSNIARHCDELNAILQFDGCKIPYAFMQLSFLSLLVIPELKIGERGLFRYSSFSWVE